MLSIEGRARKLAEQERIWWQAHHRRDKQLLLKSMAALYELLFGLSPEEAREVVKHRVEATEEHNRAEELEDNGDPSAKKAWEKVEQLLCKHFLLLLRVQQK